MEKIVEFLSFSFFFLRQCCGYEWLTNILLGFIVNCWSLDPPGESRVGVFYENGAYLAGIGSKTNLTKFTPF